MWLFDFCFVQNCNCIFLSRLPSDTTRMVAVEARVPPAQPKTLPSVAGVAIKLMLEVVREVFRNIRVTVKLIPSTMNIILASLWSLKIITSILS